MTMPAVLGGWWKATSLRSGVRADAGIRPGSASSGQNDKQGWMALQR